MSERLNTHPGWIFYKNPTIFSGPPMLSLTDEIVVKLATHTLDQTNLLDDSSQYPSVVQAPPPSKLILKIW